MPVLSFNPANTPPPAEGFSHATRARGDLVHISGQVGVDQTGAVVPGGLAAQVEQALLNLCRCLEAAGGQASDLVSVRFYVVNWSAELFGELMAGGQAAGRKHSFPELAVTLVGVAGLFTPEHLIEVDGVAVIDPDAA
ncbi:RidA family protein [Streptomyces sp. NPDC098077]|uniref:RidA family protein n=1 Tax=unclassified Streptomyces TaxID=2593676 RepID=UPI00381E4284